MKKLIYSSAIALLWFAAVFDPVGMLQLRYVALAAVLGCALWSVVFGRTGWIVTSPVGFSILLCLSAVMPLYGLLLYSVRGGATDFLDTSYIAAGLLILSSLAYENDRLCAVAITWMVMSLRLLVLVILTIYGFMLLEFEYAWVSFFTEADTALISTREYAGITLPYIYFLASPMLIFLIAYEFDQYLRSRQVFHVLVCAGTLLAFALSGTRAHIIIAVMFAPVYYVFNYPAKKLSTVLAMSAVCIVVATYYMPALVNEFFSRSEQSNELKLQLLDMYADIFSDPLVFLFGQGYNAHEWSAVLRDKLSGIEGASKTELTYMELIRVYGFPLAAVFFGLLAVLIYKVSQLDERYRWLYPALLIFLVNTALNPYLFSTNGMLPLALLIALVSQTGRPAGDSRSRRNALRRLPPLPASSG